MAKKNGSNQKIAYDRHMAEQRRRQAACRAKTRVSNHDGSCLKCDAAAGEACREKQP